MIVKSFHFCFLFITVLILKHKIKSCSLTLNLSSEILNHLILKLTRCQKFVKLGKIFVTKVLLRTGLKKKVLAGCLFFKIALKKK